MSILKAIAGTKKQSVITGRLISRTIKGKAKVVTPSGTIAINNYSAEEMTPGNNVILANAGDSFQIIGSAGKRSSPPVVIITG